MGRKQFGHAHKFARNSLHRYLKRNGKSLRNDTSRIQILELRRYKAYKALIKGCDKNFNSCPVRGGGLGK